MGTSSEGIMPILRQPPDNCPNDEVCITDYHERRRKDDKNEWIRLVIMIMASIGIAMSSGTLVWLNSQEHRLTTVEVIQREVRKDAAAMKADIQKDVDEIKKDVKELLLRKR